MKKKRVAILIAASAICLLFIFLLVNRQKDELTPREQAYEMLERMDDAVAELDGDWIKHSVTEAFPLTYENSDGSTIVYYLRLTTYYDGDPAEVTGLNADALSEHHAPATVNSMLAAVNSFLAYAGWRELSVKLLKIQKSLFLDGNKELTRAEYVRLAKAAEKQKNERLSLVTQTICATGIRVSELR